MRYAFKFLFDPEWKERGYFNKITGNPKIQSLLQALRLKSYGGFSILRKEKT